MKKVLFGLMAAILISTGCESKKSSGELLQIDLTAKDFASGQVEIADEIESVEYVPLELTDESLIANILDITVTDEYIFVYSTRQDGVLQFDRKGHFLRRIAKTGNGPGKRGRSYRSRLMKKTVCSVSVSTSLPLFILFTESLSRR